VGCFALIYQQGIFLSRGLKISKKQFRAIFMQINYSRQIGQKIVTHGKNKIFIDVQDILYLQCEGNYTMIFLKDSNKILELKPLKEFQKELSNFGFVRINNNTLVNGKFISKIFTENSKNFIKIDEITLKISRRRLKILKKQV